jgi:hypothetical protein
MKIAACSMQYCRRHANTSKYTLLCQFPKYAYSQVKNFFKKPAKINTLATLKDLLAPICFSYKGVKDCKKLLGC